MCAADRGFLDRRWLGALPLQARSRHTISRTRVSRLRQRSTSDLHGMASRARRASTGDQTVREPTGASSGQTGAPQRPYLLTRQARHSALLLNDSSRKRASSRRHASLSTRGSTVRAPASVDRQFFRAGRSLHNTHNPRPAHPLQCLLPTRVQIYTGWIYRV